MKIAIRQFRKTVMTALLGIFCLATSGCTNLMARAGVVVFQTVELCNGGSGLVTDIKVSYGYLNIGLGPGTRYLPRKEGDDCFHEGLSASTPEIGVVQWRSEGSLHEVSVPLRKYIHGNFDGFRFIVVDDHVDVYLVTKIMNETGPFYRRDFVKVHEGH